MLLAADVLEGADEPAQRFGELRAARLGIGGVAVGSKQRDRQHDPPHGGDQKSDQHRGGLGNAELLVKQHDHDRDDKRDAASDVTKGIAERGDLVHTRLGRDFGQHRIVKDVCGGVADLRDDEDHEKGHPAPSETETCAAERAEGE